MIFQDQTRDLPHALEEQILGEALTRALDPDQNQDHGHDPFPQGGKVKVGQEVLQDPEVGRDQTHVRAEVLREAQ
jgi:hypothetical protein